MDIRIEAGEITTSDARAIVVNLFQGVKEPGGATAAVDRALDGAIRRLIEDNEITGKFSEFTLIHTLGRLPSPRAVVAGLGKPEEFTLKKLRDLSANLARYLRGVGADPATTVLHGAGAGGLEPEAAAQAVVEGALLGLYRFTRHKKPEEDQKELHTLIIREADPSRLPAMQRGAERGRILAEATNACRDMANEPANHMTPTIMAERARDLAASAGLEIEVLDREQMEQRGMGGLLGVAQGSDQPPKMIVLRYRGAPASQRTLALVGKGITFDSGGISIKPSTGMEEMKGDMSGGAAVMTALWALGRLKAPVNVLAVVPATENLPSGKAIKPGDVVRAMNGTTMEVVNTDAEGRLILADALCYANSEGAAAIIDVATLTGACDVALGPVTAGVMTNNQPLCDRVLRAAEGAGELAWQLPMFEEYDELIKSDVADVKNVGGRPGGAITAAKFLAKFAGETPWVHIDMAPVDQYDKEKGIWVKGASGFPVRTLVNAALEFAAADGPAPK